MVELKEHRCFDALCLLIRGGYFVDIIIDVKIKYVSPLIGDKVKPPYYATQGSAGMDLSACINEPVKILPGEKKIIPTGIAMQLPSSEYVALVFVRSGLGINHGITLSNSVGVIDSDYRGEIKCGLVNHGNEEYIVRPGDRIAQILFIPVVKAYLNVVSELGQTDRGDGGLGSTGK